MQNQNPTHNSIETQNEPGPHGRRARRMSSTGWRRGPILAAGAVAAIGAMVGTGFVVQSAVAAQSESVAATAALTEALNPDIEQLGSHAGILEARAVKQAVDTLNSANDTITVAQGKTDATQLASSVAALDDFRLLAPERVFELVDTTEVHLATVQAGVAEADRVAAEQAAAAAAAKAAAEAAAAEAEASAPSTRPTGPANPSAAQAIARDMLAQRGWGDD